MLLRFKAILAGCAVALMVAPAALLANENEEHESTMKDQATAAEDTAYGGQDEDVAGPMEDVQESAEVLTQMRNQDAELASKVAEAKGVFVIPDYATASLLVGGSGGEGVLLTQRDGEWGNPGFYDVGNIDIGAQAGVAAGSIVMLLMNDTALETFKQENDFSLTAQAGLTIINWSADAAGSTEDGDVLVWSDTEGLLAEASVGVGGISWDEEEVREYYGQDATVDGVLSGNVQNPHESELKSEFAEFSAQSSGSAASQTEGTTDYGDKAAQEVDEYDTWEEDQEEGSEQDDY